MTRLTETRQRESALYFGRAIAYYRAMIGNQNKNEYNNL